MNPDKLTDLLYSIIEAEGDAVRQEVHACVVAAAHAALIEMKEHDSSNLQRLIGELLPSSRSAGQMQQGLVLLVLNKMQPANGPLLARTTGDSRS